MDTTTLGIGTIVGAGHTTATAGITIGTTRTMVTITMHTTNHIGATTNTTTTATTTAAEATVSTPVQQEVATITQQLQLDA